MSQPFYDWLREEGFKILGTTVPEQKAVEERREVFCSAANRLVEKHAGKVPNPMDLFEKMPREQKIGFADKVLEEGLIFLGFRKKKKTMVEEIEERQQEESIKA